MQKHPQRYPGGGEEHKIWTESNQGVQSRVRSSWQPEPFVLPPLMRSKGSSFTGAAGRKGHSISQGVGLAGTGVVFPPAACQVLAEPRFQTPVPATGSKVKDPVKGCLQRAKCCARSLSCMSIITAPGCYGTNIVWEMFKGIETLL